jgi:hypothetical protein
MQPIPRQCVTATQAFPEEALRKDDWLVDNAPTRINGLIAKPAKSWLRWK